MIFTNLAICEYVTLRDSAAAHIRQQHIVRLPAGTEGFWCYVRKSGVQCANVAICKSSLCCGNEVVWLMCVILYVRAEYVLASFQLWRKGALPANWSHFWNSTTAAEAMEPCPWSWWWAYLQRKTYLVPFLLHDNNTHALQVFIFLAKSFVQRNSSDVYSKWNELNPNCT